MRANRICALAVAAMCAFLPLLAQEGPPKAEPPKGEPRYEDTFSGPIVELTTDKLTVSRTILGKLERHAFWIKSDTKIEGKLRLKAKVTVGFVTSDDGDVARLIVVRTPQKKEMR